MYKNILIVTICTILIAGCSKKNISDQAAEYWYQEVAKDIAIGNLEFAADKYSSLIAEHIRSPLIKEATLMMAQAHLEAKEHQMANFYLDEYVKRYGIKAESDRIEYLKLLANYQGVVRHGRDQKLLFDTYDKTTQFVDRYASSELVPYVETMRSSVMLTNSYMDKKISELYTRLKKPVASEHYLLRSELELNKRGDITPPKVWFPRSLFDK